jgi:signal transduction histidine kinase
VTAETRAVAAGKRDAHFEDVHADGTHMRVYTTEVERGEAIQIARSLEEVDEVLDELALVLALVGLGGLALGAGLGVLVSRAALAPVARLSRAAREVAATRDLSRRIDPRGGSELGGLARSFNTMLNALETSLDSQRQLVADASHELRTPLTSILANLELLEAELKGEDREIAGSALRSSQRMRRLVADLLLLARADAGRQAPREPVDFAATVREATGEAAPLAERHELEVDAADSVVVDGSADDLHRLALNLIQNALVHTPAGTRVRVRLRNEDGALFEVEDDGPGIPAELRHRLFERFVRGHGDTGGGSGLGLAIVRAVAETHGGSVVVGERDGGGTRFAVRLPPARARQQAGSTS